MSANDQRPVRREHPTRVRVRELNAQHPDWSCQRIAAEIGVSAERVRQLVNATGIPVPIKRRPRRWAPT